MKLLLTLLFIGNFVYAANDNLPIGARAVGLGNAAATISDPFAVFNNIAGVASLTNTNIGVFYERRYNFSGFNIFSIVANQPTKYGNGAIGIYRFGDDLYNEMRINAGWAHKISFVSLGLQVEYLQTAIQDLGIKRNLVINFGGQAEITNQLVFGAHIYNLNQAKIADYKDERIPTIMKAGLSYKPIKQLLLNIEVEKDIVQKIKYKVGIEYIVLEKIRFRTGINIQPQVIFFGTGYSSKTFIIDYALTWHQQLGLSHSISLVYQFLRKTKLPDNDK